MPRRGKYQQFSELILEFLATSTDSGRCPRNMLVEKLGVSESTATDVLKAMEEKRLVKIGKRSFDNVHSIELTKKGRSEFDSRYVRQPFEMPVAVKRYLQNRRIDPKDFFPIQRDFAERGLVASRLNVCVFGYPGAGKTLTAELAMCNEIHNGGRVLYCTPYKALDWQKFRQFTDSFGIFSKVKVVVTDGDARVSYDELLQADIVISTYERVMGALRSGEPWLKTISLVCADEITLLAEEQRGGTLDIVLTHLRNLEQKPRIITTSSLVENTIEIAKWLNAEPVINNTSAFPMPIEECVVFQEGEIMVKWSASGRQQKVACSDPTETIVSENLKADLTTVVFTGSRQQAERIAWSLAHLYKVDPKLQEKISEFMPTLKEKSSQVENLCSLLKYGIVYHHAGLQKVVRRFVEDMIQEGLLKTVVATTTLSHGVDYKIDCVIIDIDPLDSVKNGLEVYEYINLKGRTGRPGKSKSAKVYLLTEKGNARSVFLKFFSSSPEPIYPQTTVSRSNTGSLLLSYSCSGRGIRELAGFLNKTFHCSKIDFREKYLLRVGEELVGFGFLTNSDGKLNVTELGRRVNESGLSPDDAEKALSTGTDIDSLLRTAMSIDIIRRMRMNKVLLSHGVEVLRKWMKGRSLDSIQETIPYCYDQDVLDLVSYTIASLNKMEKLADTDDVRIIITDLRGKLSDRSPTPLQKA